MARLAKVEASLDTVVAETRPNHGNSLRDLITATRDEQASMRRRMELFERQRAGREDGA